MLAGDFSRTVSYPGLNSFAPEDRPPLQLTYQTYHRMVLLWGVMLMLMRCCGGSTAAGAREEPRSSHVSDVGAGAPDARDTAGWAAAEVGRQPWIVWQELRTVDAISKAVPAGEIILTIVLFTLFYTMIYIAWDGWCSASSRRGRVGPIPVRPPSRFPRPLERQRQP